MWGAIEDRVHHDIRQQNMLTILCIKHFEMSTDRGLRRQSFETASCGPRCQYKREVADGSIQLRPGEGLKRMSKPSKLYSRNTLQLSAADIARIFRSETFNRGGLRLPLNMRVRVRLGYSRHVRGSDDGYRQEWTIMEFSVVGSGSIDISGNCTQESHHSSRRRLRGPAAIAGR